MDRYLFTTLPTNDLGLLAQSLPIAHELRERGHQAAFCSPAKAPQELISKAGFNNLRPNHPLYYLISGDICLARFVRLLFSRHLIRDLGVFHSFLRNVSFHSTAEIWDIDHFMYLFGMGNEEFIRVNVSVLLELIDTYRADAVVDFLNPFACIAARISKKKLITVIQADMHPQSQGLIWWKKPKVNHSPTPVPAVNRVLAEYNLPIIQQMGDLFVGDMTLVLGMPETDPLPETANVTYIGPILWKKQPQGLPDWIHNIDGDQPLIWLYPGNLQYIKGSSTFGDSAVVLEACIEALKNEDVRVILTTGYHSLPDRFLPLPPNFQYEPYVPGITMAEMCDLLIHHGGYGSCQIGLYTGTPSLIIPTYSERESNARKIAALGAGDFVVPESDPSGKNKQVSSQEVRTRVFKILKDTSFAENARRVGRNMKLYGGASAAACLIEDFTSSRV